MHSKIAAHGARDPFSHLTAQAMHAQAHHAGYGAAKLEETGTAGEFVTRTIKEVLDDALEAEGVAVAERRVVESTRKARR